MKLKLILLLWMGLLLGRCLVCAQVSPVAPKKCIRTNDFGVSLNFSGLELSQNSPKQIHRELLETNTIRLLAQSASLAKTELATIQLAPSPESGRTVLYQLRKPDRAFTVMSERLRAYVRAREAGHTREFFLATLTNSAPRLSKADRDLKALLATHPLLPPAWLKKVESGTITNQAGQEVRRATTTPRIKGKEATRETVYVPKVEELCRWVAFQLIDGEIAWRYTVQFKADGSLEEVRETRYDAKDFDPDYQKVIQEVENEVTAQITKAGNDTSGSSLTFWNLKKEKLRLKGINWRSPAELNPNTSFD